MQGITYLVSDTQDCDLPVFVSDNLQEIANLFGVTRASLSSMMCRKNKLRRRYLVERVNIKEDDDL